MFDTTLPIHPLTGLRALGIGKRGPIWPQLGASPDGDPADPAIPDADPTPDQGAQQDPEPDTDPATPAFAPITSQDQLDRLLGKRLGQLKAQYAGYDDYKAKATEFDRLKDSQKTNEQRLNDQLAQVQQENAELKANQLRADVAAAKGLTPKQAARLRGATREELEADADDLLEDFPKPVPLTQQPREQLRGGGKPDAEPEENDPHKLAARIPR
ncbi:hypothetical protein ACFWPK_22375 [Nocardia sp. NPDC058519]|uniref:hypothetical protein n=1 Tax=Nocardia sp. NPDC058519 TaxID=3346535 RepID=UPI00366436A4